MGVLKKLKNNADPQARRRMRREVESLRLLADAGANVSKVLDDNTEHHENGGVQLYLVTEYIPGPTLAELVKEQGPQTLDRATAIVRSICDTIKIAHQIDILHRDLKPDNLIVRDVAGPDIVIIDYGLSFNRLDEGLTETHETFRNKFIDLPETVIPGGNRHDPRSDVTAACAVLYFCLTGHAPGQLQGQDGRLPHMRAGYAVRERLLDDPRIDQLETFFSRGFSPSVQYRYQTVDEFMERLELVEKAKVPRAIEDPTAVAKRISQTLRERDRKTQLQQYLGQAEILVFKMTEYVNSILKKLDGFQLAQTSPNATFPAEYEQVDVHGVRMQVKTTHHDAVRIVHYRVGARGEQCVLLAQEFRRSAGEKKEKEWGSWQEVVWYQAEEAPPHEHAIEHFKAWLNSAMEGLAEEIFGKRNPSTQPSS